MKIVNICLGCFYVDNYSYQENLLPKYHKKMGYDVEIIASTLSFDKNGEACNVNAEAYINENNILVTRLPYSKHIPKKVAKFFRVYDNLMENLRRAQPNIIFIHGCQFWDILKICNYAKKNRVKIFVDNHADFSNSARSLLSKYILHGILWRYCAHKILPFTERFYGVLPARVDFLINIYKIPRDKVKLLIMGADDELVETACTTTNRKNIRSEYGIEDNEFLVITGGKIDHAKQQIFLLINAILTQRYNRKVKLFIFGSVVEDMKERLMSFCDQKQIFYIGWLDNETIYQYLAASDIAIYPGRHSVLWEETAGLGIPMIVKYWPGTTHIDVGGNVKFLRTNSSKEISDLLKDLCDNPNEYCNMKKIAVNRGMRKFSYAHIAKESIS